MQLPRSAAPSTIIHQEIKRRVLLHEPEEAVSATHLVWMDSVEDVFTEGDCVYWPVQRGVRRACRVSRLTRGKGLVRFALLPA